MTRFGFGDRIKDEQGQKPSDTKCMSGTTAPRPNQASYHKFLNKTLERATWLVRWGRAGEAINYAARSWSRCDVKASWLLHGNGLLFEFIKPALVKLMRAESYIMHQPYVEYCRWGN